MASMFGTYRCVIIYVEEPISSPQRPKIELRKTLHHQHDSDGMVPYAILNQNGRGQ